MNITHTNTSINQKLSPPFAMIAKIDRILKTQERKS